MAQDWDNFAVITGSAAGALTGLLFVAVSLIRDRITRHDGLRSQAGQTLRRRQAKPPTTGWPGWSTGSART